MPTLCLVLVGLAAVAHHSWVSRRRGSAATQLDHAMPSNTQLSCATARNTQLGGDKARDGCLTC